VSLGDFLKSNSSTAAQLSLLAARQEYEVEVSNKKPNKYL
jgi:hypothetical protein